MASVQEITNLECDKNPGHLDFIPLAEFTPHRLPKKYRSQRNWALIHMKAILAVKLIVKEDSGSGCITFADNCKNDKIELTVRTAAHLGFEKDKPASTTVNLFVPYTNTVLESRNVELKAIDKVDDIALLSAIFEKHNFPHLSDIHKALKPDINTLWTYVLKKYQTMKCPLQSFLDGEIYCIEHIEFASRNHDVLNIYLQCEHMYTIDVILFICVFASHPEDMRILLTKIAAGSDINTGEGCSPVTVVSPELFEDHSSVLDRLETSLCNPLSKSIMAEINECLGDLFTFAISVRLTDADNVMALRFGNSSEEVQAREETGNRGAMAQGSQFTDIGLGAMAQGSQPTDIGLGTHTWNEEQSLDSLVFEARNKIESRTDTMQTLTGIFDEHDGKEDLITYIQLKPIQKSQLKKPEQEDTLAVLISYPHGQQPQYITTGFVTRYHGCEVFYTTPSCYDGSSGCPVWLIQRKSTSSVGQLEDIRFATHSSGGEKSGTGILCLFNS